MKRPDPPPGMTEAILRATSGPACMSAHDRLCGWIDGTLPGVDDELVALHARSCSECAALAGTLRAMSADLPLLAELEPGPEFTASVMAATRPLRRASIGVRIAETWQRLIERPRFASEGAYVGAFVLLVLFGAPGSPFAGVPGRALAVASINPVEEMREPAAMIEEAVTTEVSAAWSTTRGSVTTTSRAVVGRIQGGISGLLGIFSPGVEDSARPVRERTEPPGGVGRHSDPEERAGNDPNAGDHEAARDHTDGEKR